MKIEPFKLERYFAKYEFSAKYLLSSSDCESFTMNEVLASADNETLEMWNGLKLGYTETKGHPVLREEIAKMYNNISYENVITAIPAEGIALAMNSLLDKNDHVITIFPAYQSLYQIAEFIGCEITKWFVELKDGKWTLDLNFLENNIKNNTKMIILNFPHNPTGYLPDHDTFMNIIKIAEKHGVYVFCDEMYKFLEYNPADRLPSAGEIYERGISLSGLSKSFGLPGLRSGWLFTKNEAILNEMSSFRDYTTICSSAPSEILSIIAVRNKEKFIGRCLDIINTNYSHAKEFFTNNDKVEWIDIKAGPIAFPKINTDKDIYDFCEEFVQTKNTMLVPANMFDYPGNHVRLGMGRMNFKEAFTNFTDFILASK